MDTRIHDVGRPLTKGNWPIELVVASRLKSILSLDYKYLQVSHNCISTKISVNKYNNVNYELINYGLPYIFILHNVFFFFLEKTKTHICGQRMILRTENLLNYIHYPLLVSDLHLATVHKL